MKTDTDTTEMNEEERTLAVDRAGITDPDDREGDQSESLVEVAE